MEMKYNSLKEALPSLLEEKARLEEEYGQIGREYNKLYFSLGLDDWSRINLFIVLKMLTEGISSEVITKCTGFKAVKIEELAAGPLIEFKKIMSKESDLETAMSRLSALIQATQDISSIVGVNFKKQYEGYQHLFDAVFNDILNNNSLTWLDSLACIYKFSKINHDSLSIENMPALIEKAIITNIPAYMYLVAVKITNIPDEDMKQLIAAIVASNDKKYIDYLVLYLSKKGVSKELSSFIASLNISIDAATIFNYDENFADELEQALLEDNLETLYKHGMYSYEDRAYVLSNIQAGL